MSLLGTSHYLQLQYVHGHATMDTDSVCDESCTGSCYKRVHALASGLYGKGRCTFAVKYVVRADPAILHWQLQLLLTVPGSLNDGGHAMQHHCPADTGKTPAIACTRVNVSPVTTHWHVSIS